VTFNWLELHRRSHEEFGRRLAAVTDWSAPTPDEDWDTRALVRHVIAEQQIVPHLLSGVPLEEARQAVDPLDDDDLRAEWERYSPAAIAAWDEAPSSGTVRLMRDTLTLDDYLREQVSDIAIHAWDLARATGSDETLHPDLVEAAWSIFEPQKATLEASGLYASAVPVPEDAPLQVRLLALTGRTVTR
jgi:uncharacterized protein (TIGR03086 family)